MTWDESGFVYLLVGEATGRVKVGFSQDPERRWRELDRTCSENLKLVATVPGCRFEEAQLHDQIAGARVKGEWYESLEAVHAILEKLVARRDKKVAA